MNCHDNVPEIICFYHEYDEYGCFSNWFKSEFEYAGRKYSSVEQYMMYQKVLLFREYDLAEQIISTDDPATIKKLGRTKFPTFNGALWDSISYTVVKRGVRAKFMQNYDILKILLNTKNCILAEASMNDGKWGIGVAINDSNCYKVQKWTGKNLLGRILMEVRDELKRVPFSELSYIDATDLDFSEWHMTAGELVRMPKYHSTIKAYADTLNNNMERDAFYNQCPIYDWEIAMRVNMGGGLSALGFWEMKQDIFDITRL